MRLQAKVQSIDAYEVKADDYQKGLKEGFKGGKTQRIDSGYLDIWMNRDSLSIVAHGEDYDTGHHYKWCHIVASR